MKKTKVPINTLADFAHKLLKKYDENVAADCLQIYADIADETVKKLKDKSPESSYNRKGKTYKASWTKKKIKEGYNTQGFIIYNRKGQLTHLIEFGHPIIAPYYKKNGGTAIGRAEAHPHIKPVADEMREELIKRLKERLSEEDGNG